MIPTVLDMMEPLNWSPTPDFYFTNIQPSNEVSLRLPVNEFVCMHTQCHALQYTLYIHYNVYARQKLKLQSNY